jgi:glutamate 5-kinase
MPTAVREQIFSRARRVVVKVGSGVLTRTDGLNRDAVRDIAEQIYHLIESGRQVLLVSSGAMAAGFKKLGLAARPEDIPGRQAAAAVGQPEVMAAYEDVFDRFGVKTAQILLTGDGLSYRKRYLNARNTLFTLFSWGVIPIVNENDTVSVEEIQFGDNDNLAAMMAFLINADVVVNITTIEGLYTADPRNEKNARLIDEVGRITRKIEQLAGDIPGALGTGGMKSKITAARKLNRGGIPMVIAGGRTPSVLDRLFAGETLGTFFMPRPERMGSRKRWIGFSVQSEGILGLDDGAAAAVVKGGKSLLPGGVVSVSGNFDVGAAVLLTDAKGDPLGTGLVNYSAADVRLIMGKKTDRIAEILGAKPYDEIIHRDNLTVTADDGDEQGESYTDGINR